MSTTASIPGAKRITAASGPAVPKRSGGAARRRQHDERYGARDDYGRRNWTHNRGYERDYPAGYDRERERGGYYRTDRGYIREDICDRLTRHGRIDATDIQIQVRNGEVTLDGIVDTREAKRMAEDVAESVDGVRDVINHLKTHRTEEVITAGRKDKNL